MFPVYLKDVDFSPPEDPIYYLIAGNGIYLIKNHPLFLSKTQVTELPWLEREEPGFHFRGPLVDRSLLARVLAFFLCVWKHHQAESVVILYGDPPLQNYTIRVPHQTVGGIHCIYQEPLLENEQDLRLGTIHSHGCEDPFHSERDDADEQFQDGLHLIFGNLDSSPKLLCSAMVDGRRFPLPCEALIEGMPDHEAIKSWRNWAERQRGEFVKPMKKPIYFGT